MNRMEISCLHPWQNSPDIRNHIWEGSLWQFSRVVIARVERTSTYLASRGVESRLFEVWIGSCRENSGQAPQRAGQSADGNEAEAGLVLRHRRWLDRSAARAEPFTTKATKRANVGSVLQAQSERNTADQQSRLEPV